MSDMSETIRKSGRLTQGEREGAVKKYLPRLLVLSLLSAFTFPLPCAACSCLGLAPAEKSAKADVIFRGRVTAIAWESRGTGAQSGVRFQVDTSWKGPVTREMVVNPDEFWWRCGEHFTRGQEYLVYANGSNPDALTLRICGAATSLRSLNQNPYLRADLDFLGPGTAVGHQVPAQMPNVGAGPGMAPSLSPLVVAGALAILLASLALVLPRVFPKKVR